MKGIPIKVNASAANRGKHIRISNLPRCVQRLKSCRCLASNNESHVLPLQVICEPACSG